MTDASKAEGGRQPPGEGAAEKSAPPPPPPLASIRVAGPKPRGLNKRAIIILAGGAGALGLVLASGAFGRTSKPDQAAPKPMQSAPARPEMAAGAVRDLPKSYAEVAHPTRSQAPAPERPGIELGPPAKDDFALFGADETAHQVHAANASRTARSQQPSDAAADEVDQARRSGLFFALNETAGEKPKTANLPSGSGSARAAVDRPNKDGAAMRRVAADGTNASVSADDPDNGPDGRPALFPGTVLGASLLTGVNSEEPGPVIAQVTHTAFDSLTGRTPLIPQGAKLIGTYRSASGHGQSRLSLVWSRIIFPDGNEIALDEPASDPAGAAGLAGKVDNHWAATFGAAALGTLVNISAATLGDQPRLGVVNGGIGAVSGDPAQAALSDGIERTSDLVSSRIVNRALGVAPTIRIRAGARISVIVTRRIDLKPWPPV